MVFNFAPSANQVALIIGGKIATNTEGVEQLPDNLVKAANNFLIKVNEESSEQ